ncbi:hypothetical protein CAPTEDRAFT_180602 [Capitella teleta]|uniref:MBD domain-containing protein n=1 Tax=Capitella teleta TaxID=283909 RepID=R7TNW3_CAPTE|nr:hypothetical protein CAPTEDRAFT_180602 [Capitella teleta]|eukprot:ELT95247.1 hypothetical protein CAPTEDRAFT_180602 [Capitella teleta]
MNATERRRLDIPGLPPGWRREENVRKSGLSAGKTDVYYISPDGTRVRSKPQLCRMVGDAVDLNSFDFRTGKILQSSIRKSKRMRGSSYDFARGLSNCFFCSTVFFCSSVGCKLQVFFLL